jgi:hypothetical protein
MSCVTWLGRIVTRVFATGLVHHQQSVVNANGGGLISFSSFSSIFRRNFQSVSSSSSAAAGLLSSSFIAKETAEEIARMSTKKSTICRTLHERWSDLHLGPGFVSVVSGLPKDFASSTFRKGQFGDDAWFIARNKSADVIGELILSNFDGIGGLGFNFRLLECIC